MQNCSVGQSSRETSSPRTSSTARQRPGLTSRDTCRHIAQRRARTVECRSVHVGSVARLCGELCCVQAAGV